MEEEEELTERDFFTTDEVYQITALVNEELAGVVYHYWINTASGQRFEVLDWITLVFKSGERMTFTAGLETDGIKIAEPDFEAERKRLEEEFKGTVTIESKDASKSKFWKETIGKSITPSLLKHEGRVLNDSLVLKFEDDNSVEIFLGLEGLEVDFFDEEAN